VLGVVDTVCCRSMIGRVEAPLLKRQECHVTQKTEKQVSTIPMLWVRSCMLF
jgi:hypothetical protein